MSEVQPGLSTATGMPATPPVRPVPPLSPTSTAPSASSVLSASPASSAPFAPSVHPVPWALSRPPALPGSRTPPALPVLPALRELLPRGGLARGSVVAVAGFGLLALALLAGASAAGAWSAIAGIPEAGVLAAVGLGLDVERTLLVPDPGMAWPLVVASLLDGCELVLLRPPARAPAAVRQRLEATLRRGHGVLVVAGDWPGAQVRLQVVSQGWTGLGDGHGRFRACCAEVIADGRGEAAMTRTRWLWLPAEDGSVAVAEPPDIPAADIPAADLPDAAGHVRRLRAVNG